MAIPENVENAGEITRHEFFQILSSRRQTCELEVHPCKSPQHPILEAPLDDLPVPGHPCDPKKLEELQEERLILKTEAGEQGQLPVVIIKKKILGQENVKRPAVVIVHSSFKCKEYLRPLVQIYALRGYIAVSIDSRHHGQRASSVTSYQEALVHAWKTGETMPFIFDTVWDCMRLMDYLSAREDIDANRIGMTGISLGGMITLYTLAVDPRFAVGVPVIGVQNFGWAVENNRWNARVASIRHVFEVASQDLGKVHVDKETVAKVWDRIAPGLMDKFDVLHVLKAIVPRPLLILNGRDDPRCPFEGLEQCVREVAALYANAGFPDHFKFVAEEGIAHRTTETMLASSMQWFDDFL